jgi:hypothetical protein
MSRIPLLVLSFLALVTLAACGSRSPEESCKVVCEKSALCQEGVSASSCTSLCLDLAKDDEAYAKGVAQQADCYEEQADYYEEEKGVCLAIEGGACRIQPD